MRLFFSLFLSCLFFLPLFSQISQLPLPNAQQLAWQEAEFGVVFHYDLHVFDGRPYRQQNNRIKPVADYNIFHPARLDTDQWIKAAKDAGATFAILTATQETGFALYQSDVNPYSLKALRWRDGKGDIVRDFVESCRKYGLKPGIYVGIRWNAFFGIHNFKVRGEGTFRDNRQTYYNRMCEGMVEELCTRYGELFEIWFDGGADHPDRGVPDVLPIVQKYQPNCLFYHNGQLAEARWGGSESGMVAYPCWSTFPYPSVDQGQSIGHKRIQAFPAVEASALRITIEESVGEPQIKNFSAYYVKDYNPDENLDLGAFVKPISEGNIFRDEAYFNWGGSIIKGPQGKYHLFYARWKRDYSFYGWLTHSEIAHAVAENPAGPYRYVETVLKGRGPGHWDAITAHNPKIKIFNGKYYLYYISTNSGDEALGEEALLETARTGYSHDNWLPLRNKQRTGVAIAESLDGPWRRFDAPIVEPAGPITTLTVNPAITRGPDENYYLIVKGDKPDETRFIRNQAMATSRSPTGPFTVQPEPVIGDLDTEDASLWYDEERRRFYAVFHGHSFIGLITSVDGLNWEKATHYQVIPKKLRLAGGGFLTPDRLERPFVFFEEGEPKALLLAAKQGADSYTVVVELDR